MRIVSGVLVASSNSNINLYFQGNIRRVWPGCAKEMFTDADTYTCTFPPSATAVHKGKKNIVFGEYILLLLYVIMSLTCFVYSILFSSHYGNSYPDRLFVF